MNNELKTFVVIGLALGLCIPLVLSSPSGTAQSSEWSVPMQATTPTEGENTNLEFGTVTGATDSYDSEIDIPHPPPGVGVDCHAYFEIDHFLFPQLDKDYRDVTMPNQWTLHVESDSEDITLNWDDSGVPADISLRLTGSGKDLDMKETSSTVLAAGVHTMTISAEQSSLEVSFASDTYTFNEASGLASIEVALSGTSTETVTVQYYSSDGSAVAGDDYTAVSGTLTFSPGEASSTFEVPLVADITSEGTETVNLTLSNPVNASPGSPTQSVLIIEDGRVIDIYVDLQGDNRPVEGWEIPIHVGFYPPGSSNEVLLNPASATFYFSGTTTISIAAGTQAYFQCPASVVPGTYDITADSETTLLNVKRGVFIQ